MFPGRVGDHAVVAEGLPSLLREMELAEITTPRRQAAFLATLAHESGFLYNVPQKNATSTFKGRGYIQLTGSGNYASAGKYLGVDLLGHPDEALSLEWSAKIARWYWTVNRHCNQLADNLQMGRVNAAIGYPVGDGTEDLRRCASFENALKYLSGSVPAGVEWSRSAPAWSSSERLGQWSTEGVLVNNNIHNAAEAGTQAITAYNAGQWMVVADHSRTDVRPGSVKSYPDTQRNFDQPINAFKKLVADYSMTCPPVGEYNSAFDCWINGIGSKSTHEIMIWTDHRYPASLPPANAVDRKSPTIDGQPFIAWRRPNGNGGQYIALVMDPKKPAGSVDLLKVFNWLASVSWLSLTDRIAAVEFGVEISNTPGPQTFHLNNYKLTTE